jgi:hypothetical protein
MSANWNGRENIWIITSTGDIDTRDLWVREIRWVGQTAGDTCDIQDFDGNSLWQAVASANNVGDIHDGSKRRWRTGFKVTTLSSGTLYVYCE